MVNVVMHAATFVIIVLVLAPPILSLSPKSCRESAKPCQYTTRYNTDISVTFDIKPFTGICALNIWGGQLNILLEMISVTIRCPGFAYSVIHMQSAMKYSRVETLVLQNCVIYWKDLQGLVANIPLEKMSLYNCMDEFGKGENLVYFNLCANSTYHGTQLPNGIEVRSLHVSSSVVRPVSEAFTHLSWPSLRRLSFDGYEGFVSYMSWTIRRHIFQSNINLLPVAS